MTNRLPNRGERWTMSARSGLGGDLVEVKLHGFGVAGRHHEGGGGSAFRAHRTEQVGGLGPLIVSGPRTQAVLAQR